VLGADFYFSESELDPSFDTNSRSLFLEVLCLLCETKVHYCAHKSPSKTQFAAAYIQVIAARVLHVIFCILLSFSLCLFLPT